MSPLSSVIKSFDVLVWVQEQPWSSALQLEVTQWYKQLQHHPRNSGDWSVLSGLSGCFYLHRDDVDEFENYLQTLDILLSHEWDVHETNHLGKTIWSYVLEWSLAPIFLKHQSYDHHNQEGLIYLHEVINSPRWIIRSITDEDLNFIKTELFKLWDLGFDVCAPTLKGKSLWKDLENLLMDFQCSAIAHDWFSEYETKNLHRVCQEHQNLVSLSSRPIKRI